MGRDDSFMNAIPNIEIYNRMNESIDVAVTMSGGG